MTDFEFFLAFYGLLLGLSVAELTSGVARTVEARHTVRLGVLTPLLGIFMLLDISSFWVWAWRTRASVHVTMPLLLLAMAITTIYYLCASLTFPRQPERFSSLDDHYWKIKRFVVVGVMIANVFPAGSGLMTLLAHPALVFMGFLAIYYLGLVVLLLSRSRRIDIAVLVVEIMVYLVGAFF